MADAFICLTAGLYAADTVFAERRRKYVAAKCVFRGGTLVAIGPGDFAILVSAVAVKIAAIVAGLALKGNASIILSNHRVRLRHTARRYRPCSRISSEWLCPDLGLLWAYCPKTPTLRQASIT
ncbi:hypothetical protein TWF481_010249 [Arthrobotrys musiformis]|uniref:Uncharacterized protein n=1 Tax=Arthrobotrys musiformis TaxID=47236 RepID=A0AAV9W0F9_9PEZI